MRTFRLAPLLLLATLLPIFVRGGDAPATPATVAAGARPPRLFPDYADVVLPPNIAPLNFRIEEPGKRYEAQLHSTFGPPVVVRSKDGTIQFPLAEWRRLVRTNAGHPLRLDVAVEDAGGAWTHFLTVTNQIAREPVDSHLAYRLLKPLYSLYSTIGLYQRDLETFQQRPLVENRHTGNGCLNCHTFLNRQPDTFAFHTRTNGPVHPMVLVVSNEPVRVDKTMGYLSWHPSGRLLTFSANKLTLFYHTHGGDTRDVFDAKSHLGIYRVDSNTVVLPPVLSPTNRNLTWPSWAPDGRHLYFCSTPRRPLEEFREVRYDLVRVPYDLERDQWGEPETLVAAQDTGLSAAQPRVSPDGRFVLFTLCKFGNFPIYRPTSDLYLLDLTTRRWRRLDINSSQADSWHCWSSNGRWVVFSSKRLDGLFARPFFSYVDTEGNFHKPFLLPQEDPEFYDTCLQTFNLPDFVTGPVKLSEADLARAVTRPAKVRVPATPAGGSAGSSQPAGMK